MRGRARRSSFHGSSTWELLFSAGIRGPSTVKGPEEHPTGVCSGLGTATSGQTSQQRGKHFWEAQCHGAGLKLLGITPSACRAASCPWDSPGAAAVPVWARGEAALPQLPASALLSNTTLTIISANNAANRRGRVGRR